MRIRLKPPGNADFVELPCVLLDPVADEDNQRVKIGARTDDGRLVVLVLEPEDQERIRAVLQTRHYEKSDDVSSLFSDIGEFWRELTSGPVDPELSAGGPQYKPPPAKPRPAPAPREPIAVRQIPSTGGRGNNDPMSG